MRAPLIFPLTYTHEERVAQARAFNDYFNNLDLVGPKRGVRVARVMSRWLDQNPKNERVYMELMAWLMRGTLLKIPPAQRRKIEEQLNASWEELHNTAILATRDPAS
jgi:hypothetical protein